MSAMRKALRPRDEELRRNYQEILQLMSQYQLPSEQNGDAGGASAGGAGSSSGAGPSGGAGSEEELAAQLRQQVADLQAAQDAYQKALAGKKEVEAQIEKYKQQQSQQGPPGGIVEEGGGDDSETSRNTPGFGRRAPAAPTRQGTGADNGHAPPLGGGMQSSSSPEPGSIPQQGSKPGSAR